MALRSIAPFPCTPLLRCFRATAATSTTLRTGFRIRYGTGSVFRCVCSGNRKLISSPFGSRGTPRRAGHQLGVDFRSARANSSVNGQGVAEDEDTRGANSKSGLLILYSKPGCCLCDSLKEKLEGSEIFSQIELEVRDITTNSEWWNLYQYEIPVLARVRVDGTEEALPRLSPRLSAEQVQKKILAVMTSVA